MLRFVAIYALSGRLWAEKSAFLGKKTVFLGQEVHYYMVYTLMKIFMATFAFDERLPFSATLQITRIRSRMTEV